MDYNQYHFTKKQWIYQILLYAVIDGIVSVLFYRSVLAFILFFSGFFFFLKERKSDYILAGKKELSQQFLTGIQAVSAALAAGYSVENAFEEALEDLERVFEKEDKIIKEFTYIRNQIKLNNTLENLLLDLAKRSRVEEIENFAEVFSAAKRSGGDLIAIIRNTILCISQKEETKMEIETCLSAKRLEQKIMSGVPFIILIYVGAASPGFLDVMYYNPAGICIMSLCLAMYVAAFLWGKKIVEIEV
ncbi:type II secretion system F family protein [uncultured Robinsoniella sp.]|uniref:type II secretion system F family protein n=1 Tax=uncultured Robinsoniella sp. TaxID=904190 RepID=UPI00374F2FED